MVTTMLPNNGDEGEGEGDADGEGVMLILTLTLTLMHFVLWQMRQLEAIARWYNASLLCGI